MAEAKWPLKADGETVRDRDGGFYAAAATANDAKLVAAAPLLWLHYNATKLGNAACADGVALEIEAALKGWRP